MLEQSVKRSWRKQNAISCLIVVGPLLLLTVGIPLLPKSVNKTDSSAVGQAFIRALLSNDARTANALILPEVQPWLDNWMTEHPPFICPFLWHPSDWLKGEGFGVGSERGDEASWGYGEDCSADDYHFGISVNMKLVGQEW